jgi:hypothetical protein
LTIIRKGEFEKGEEEDMILAEEVLIGWAEMG